MGELPGRNVAKTGKGKNWKSRGRGKEKNMVVEYIPLCEIQGIRDRGPILPFFPYFPFRTCQS